jgi:hypothetical protein
VLVPTVFAPRSGLRFRAELARRENFPSRAQRENFSVLANRGISPWTREIRLSSLVDGIVGLSSTEPSRWILAGSVINRTFSLISNFTFLPLLIPRSPTGSYTNQPTSLTLRLIERPQTERLGNPRKRSPRHGRHPQLSERSMLAANHQMGENARVRVCESFAVEVSGKTE